MKKNLLFRGRILSVVSSFLCSFLLLCSSSFAQYNPMPGSPYPPNGIGWLDNGTVKIAVDLNYGGAVTYFSKSNTNVNTVNNSDHGRQMQWAVYSGPDNFAANGPDPMWQTLGWNPIEAGDCKNNAPQVITYANNGTTIYTKLQPYHWPILTTYAECYFEKWITLDGNAAKVHFRFTSFRSDQTVYYERRQELPCLYTQPQYSRHVFYDGDNPWVNAPVTTSTNPAFLLNQVSESWMAAEEPSTGDAVGLWGQNHYDFARLIVGDASYMAVEPKYKFYPGKVEDYDAAIIAGTVSQIRNWVYAQTRPAVRPDFQFNGTRNRFNTYDMNEAGTPTTQWDLTVPNVSDWNINSPTIFFKSTDVPKLYVTAAFDLSNVTSMGIGWNRYGQGSGNILQLNQYVTFPIINDGQYHTYEVDMTGNPNWTSGINQLLLIRNPSITGATSGTVKLRSISYQSPGCTAPAAPGLSASPATINSGSSTTLTATGCSGGTINWSNGLGTGASQTVTPTTTTTYTATCTVNGCTSPAGSVTVTVNQTCTSPSAPTISVTSQNTTTCSDGSRTVTLTATGCSGTVNWSNGQTGSSINVTTPGNYTATCTVSTCTSTNSNTVTVSNGTDCGGGGVNPPGSYGGSFDGANCDYINGWVWNGTNHRVVYEIIDQSNGNAVVYEGVASDYRGDLQTAGIGDGAHGFWISTPTALKNGQPHNLAVRAKGISFTLANSPKSITCAGCTAPSAPGLSASPSTINSGSSSTLTATGCSGGTITWSNGLGTGASKTVNPTSTTTYTATCTVDGCTSSSSSVTVTVNPVCTPPSAPSISITGPNTTTCSDGSRTVTLTATGCSGTVTWSNGQTGSSINVTTPGNYTATCTAGGCTSSNSNTVTLSNGTDCGGGGVNPPGTYGGTFDGATCDYINGWVWNGTNHRVVYEVIDVSNGNAVVYEGVANDYRGDLQTAGIGDGVHGFWISTPSSLKNGQAHSIAVRVKGINFTLSNSPKSITCSNQRRALDPSAEELPVNKQLMIFPNPNKGVFETSFFVERGKKATIVISDLLGRTIYTKTISGQGLHREKIDLSGKASGMVLVQLHDGNKMEVKKINILR